MRRLLLLTLIASLAVGLMLAQGTDDQSENSEDEEEREISFVLESEIGRALPRRIIYDPNFERLAVVDAYGQLLLVDGLTYETQHILYESGNYNDLAFSNDGQWLALAIDSRIELYNAETGELTADLVDLSSAIQIVGPLSFSRDDNLLKFEGIYPAPRSIRLSENDTIRVPWLWNLTAARNEGDSTFPRQLEAWQFFDYRNGFVLGPDDRVVAALPGRLQVLDAYSLEVLFEIPTARYERDPLTVWFSSRDNKIYVRPVDENTLLQVDTQNGVLVEIPLGEWLTTNDLEQVGGVELSEQTRLIGEPNNRRSVDLLELFLGSDYTTRGTYRLRPLTVTLIDLIIPPAATGENITALLFVFDERLEEGRFTIVRSFNIEQMILSSDEENLIVRRNVDGEEFIVKYDFETGEQVDRFIPALRSIGSYSRTAKNRVLAYNDTGEVLVSDFQRYDAESLEVLAEDLRYSRRFDRFYFTSDSQGVVTLAGTEWRLWDVNTGEVLRREVLALRGSIIATSSDGFRFLTRYNSRGVTGMEVVDLNDDTRHSVEFRNIPGSSVDLVIPDADWEQFFITYTPNQWGQYFPGNQIAMYDLDEGQRWFIAGDDLPPVEERQYGWVGDETVYVRGAGVPSTQPARVYGVDYDPNGLPECIVEAFPDQVDTWLDLWERLVLSLRPDALANLSQLLCADLPDTAGEVQQLLVPTATPEPITPTPIVIPGVPVCLTARYPERAEEFAQTWREIIEGLPEDQIEETERLLCEGIGEFSLGTGREAAINVTMLIDAQTGERATGAFTPIERVSRPIGPIQEEFERTEERPLGQAILSPDEEFVAASNLPGELVIYRLVRPYQDLLDVITATAVANLEQRNLIGVLPSPTPTYNAVGTPRPTLTPTVTPTPILRPDELVEQPRYGEIEEFCPSEELLTLDNLPEGYNPPGRLIGPVQGDDLWVINPISGRRAPDETIPACGRSLDCRFSPDRSWILVPTINEVFVIRPDGSDERVLFGEPSDEFPDLEPPPPFINWSGPRTVEYETIVEIEINNRIERFTALQRDILGVFPDPDPWIPRIRINDIPATLVSRQPGGPWALAYTTYSTGVGPGYKYYLYNVETGDYEFFARIGDNSGQLSSRWHPLGDRFFYYYPPPIGRAPTWYQIDMVTDNNRLLDDFIFGNWSNEGRYIAFNNNSRTQPIGVYDSETGLTRTYCLPETGARFYEGGFTWSPDSRYVALQAFLPEDENEEGVGQHTMILDIETGDVIDLTTGVGPLVDWSRDAGEYGEDD